MTVLKDMNQSDRKHTKTGSGDDAEKTAQSISSQDIRAVAISAEPVDERLAALRSMKTELEARLSADRGSDLGPLVDEVDNAIENLSSAGGEAGVRSATAAD
ncbi:MAG: hypothetical protein JJ920_13240 [Roseitalea sp.]|jgi:hypothetical protein|nr:hypothetical protein [Roseitalea sp.]MBO6720724.1 hypothetical protein [Roseitalea sp.]MBO6743871.1 hypothetical protein [Roseitalea sp.]